MNRTIYQLLRIVARYARLQFRAEPEFNSPNYNPPSAGGDGPSTLAVITLICGVLTWTFLPILAGLVGCVTGWIELGNIKKGVSSEDGKLITQIGLAASAAQVGLACITTCVFTALNLGAIAVFIGALFAGAAGAQAPN